MGGLCVGGMDGGGISAHPAKKKRVTPKVDVRGRNPSFREERRTGPSSVPSPPSHGKSGTTANVILSDEANSWYTGQLLGLELGWQQPGRDTVQTLHPDHTDMAIIRAPRK